MESEGCSTRRLLVVTFGKQQKKDKEHCSFWFSFLQTSHSVFYCVVDIGAKGCLRSVVYSGEWLAGDYD